MTSPPPFHHSMSVRMIEACKFRASGLAYVSLAFASCLLYVCFALAGLINNWKLTSYSAEYQICYCAATNQTVARVTARAIHEQSSYPRLGAVTLSRGFYLP